MHPNISIHTYVLEQKLNQYKIYRMYLSQNDTRKIVKPKDIVRYIVYLYKQKQTVE